MVHGVQPLLDLTLIRLRFGCNKQLRLLNAPLRSANFHIKLAYIEDSRAVVSDRMKFGQNH